MFLFIIRKISNHQSQVYRISHLIPSNPPSIVVPKVSLHQMTLIHLKFQVSLLHQIQHLRVTQEVSKLSILLLLLMKIIKKIITSNDTCLTISISDIFISEGLPFNIPQKPGFKKVLELSKKLSNTYIPPNRKLISKEQLDVTHEENMKRNLTMIKKEAEIFGLLFLGDGATISICPLLNILTSAKNIPVSVL